MNNKKETKADSINTVNNDVKPSVKQSTYSREQLVSSSKYCKYIDVINSFMSKDERITLSELDEKIEKFMKKEIK